MVLRANGTYNQSPSNHVQSWIFLHPPYHGSRSITFILRSLSYFHHPPTKPQLERMLSTIRSPILCAISVHVTSHILIVEDEEVPLPKKTAGEVWTCYPVTYWPVS